MRNNKNSQKDKGQKPRKAPNNRHQSKPHKRSGGQNEQRANTSSKAKISLFGTHAVREAWLNPKRYVHALYITETAYADFEDIIAEGQRNGLKRPEPEIIDKSVLDRALPQGSVHQGIGLNVQALEEPTLRDVTIEAEVKGKSVLMILDQVTDPHNVGAIIRSACVFGADALVMQKKHAPELNGVLAKTACGGVEHLKIVYETNLSRAIEALQQEGYFVVGLDERGEQNIADLPSYDKIALVMGAEGPGLRRLVREGCDQLVKLPTAGKISSLNVSNAAAVSLYAVSQD